MESTLDRNASMTIKVNPRLVFSDSNAGPGLNYVRISDRSSRINFDRPWSHFTPILQKCGLKGTTKTTYEDLTWCKMGLHFKTLRQFSLRCIREMLDSESVAGFAKMANSDKSQPQNFSSCWTTLLFFLVCNQRST